MDFRDYAQTETSAFVGRLIAAAEASADQVRVSADGEIGTLRAEADGLREQAENLRSQADSYRAASESLRAEADGLREQVESLRGQTDTYREATESLRAEADGLREQIDRLHGETHGLRAELEAETAHAASLAADLETLQQTRGEIETRLRQVDAARAHAETELRDVGEQLDAARADVARVSEAFKAEVSRAAAALEEQAARTAALQEGHDEIVRGLQAHHEEIIRELHARRDDTVGQLQAQHDEAVRGLQIRHDEAVRQLHAELEAAGSGRQDDTERAGALERRLHEADAALASMRRQVVDANAMTDAVHQGMAAARVRSQRVMTSLRSSVRRLDALGLTATAADVFTTLVDLLAAEFPRVAIFRRKGNHLVGELGAGIDDAIDITKLVIPVGLDSVISRAAAGGMLEQATAEQIVESRPPFGGTPASALAAPLVFQGETLAVVYADSDDAPNDAHAALVGMLVGHANVLLSRLAQELKTAKVLREYAQMLLHEAEQMYLADLAEGRPEGDRLRRLHDTIEFGRQLYDQRAALEGNAAGRLLEDEIAALIRAEPMTPFGSGLAAALTDAPAQRTAS